MQRERGLKAAHQRRRPTAEPQGLWTRGNRIQYERTHSADTKSAKASGKAGCTTRRAAGYPTAAESRSERRAGGAGTVPEAMLHVPPVQLARGKQAHSIVNYTVKQHSIVNYTVKHTALPSQQSAVLASTRHLLSGGCSIIFSWYPQ